jgi:hypothetical protein
VARREAAPEPLAAPAADHPTVATRVTVCLLVLGLSLRLGHYLWNHTVWYDESVLLANVMGKGYAELLGPLDHAVAAPPLFLWGLRALYLTCGDHPYLWRLPPFLAGCLTLLGMAALARRVLPPPAACLVVGLVAFSDAFVRLGSTVKPYAFDALLTVGFLYAYRRTESWPLPRRLLAYAAAAPVLLTFSYPMLFLYAALGAALLGHVWRQRRLASWAAYLGLVAVVLGTFAALYLGPIRSQRVPSLVAEWHNKFPDLSRPLSVPGWVAGNTVLVFHYCYSPVGVLLLVLAAVGAWRHVRAGRADWVWVCLGPLAFCLGAAFLEAYPYSNNRLMLFAAPGIGLMAAGGLAAIWDWPRGRPWWLPVSLVAALLVPEAAGSAWRVYSPWWLTKADGVGVQRFVREHRRPGDVVASDEGNYGYFFFGEVRPVADVIASPVAPGRRVWVLVDGYTPDERRLAARWRLPEPAWELSEERHFRLASAFLFVRRADPPGCCERRPE